VSTIRTALPERPAVVVNPTKVDDGNTEAVEKSFADRGLPAPRWYETTEDDPGEGQAKQAMADGADLVLAQGGDGTVRAVAAALAGAGVPLGLLPAGTGNLLARNLGVPRDLDGAVGVLTGGTSREVDVLEIDGEPYVVMGGSGFDAQLFELTSDDLKARVGWAAYVSAGIRAVRAATPYEVRITTDRESLRVQAVGVVVGNVGTLTAGIELLPDAEADDARLHVAVLTPLRLRDWVGLGWSLVWRRTPRGFQMRTLRAKEVTVQWPVELPTEIDGDLVDPRWHLRVVVRPAALIVRVPLG
jgi:diacylglycerol kinase family enzyme